MLYGYYQLIKNGDVFSTGSGRRTVRDRGRPTFESPYKVGSSLSDEQLERLVEESRRRRSREKALYLLSLRDYSRSELEKKLRRDFDENTARETAGRIEELGLINDTSFARNRAKDLMKRKLYPSRRIFQELLALGVDRETAQEAVDGLDCDA